MADMTDQDPFLLAMRKLASGVTIITTGEGDQRFGLTATSFCSLAADPPMILCCVARATDANTAIRANEQFSVNILSLNDQSLADRFAGRNNIFGTARFASGEWSQSEHNNPKLATALTTIDAKLVSSSEAGTHTIFIGAVTDQSTAISGEPLVYFDGDYATVKQT